MAIEQKFIYEYWLENQETPNPKLVVNAVKVDVLPKTYRRVGRRTWKSSTKVWFKVDEGVVISERLILSERDDAKALKAFVDEDAKKIALRERRLKNAIERFKRIKSITSAVEIEEP